MKHTNLINIKLATMKHTNLINIKLATIINETYKLKSTLNWLH